MIINKNAANDIGVTLKEKTTLNPVYYLFEFVHTATNEKQYCICEELSTVDEIDRCNKFIITEMGDNDANNLDGEIKLKTRDYVYNVYETSSLDIDPTGLTLVETGFASCIDSTTNLNKEYEGASLSNKVYNG